MSKVTEGNKHTSLLHRANVLWITVVKFVSGHLPQLTFFTDILSAIRSSVNTLSVVAPFYSTCDTKTTTQSRPFSISLEIPFIRNLFDRRISKFSRPIFIELKKDG